MLCVRQNLVCSWTCTGGGVAVTTSSGAACRCPSVNTTATTASTAAPPADLPLCCSLQGALPVCHLLQLTGRHRGPRPRLPEVRATQAELSCTGEVLTCPPVQCQSSGPPGRPQPPLPGPRHLLRSHLPGLVLPEQAAGHLLQGQPDPRVRRAAADWLQPRVGSGLQSGRPVTARTSEKLNGRKMLGGAAESRNTPSSRRIL